MPKHRHIQSMVLGTAASVLLLATLVGAQSKPAHPIQAAVPAAAQPTQPSVLPVSEKDLAATQRELIRLLRLSPTLTTVVARDPALLANQEYVTRNNPELAKFLIAHPEIARNPEFYLFTHARPGDGSPDEALERAVWPELVQPPYQRPAYQELISDLPAILGFATFLAALIWLIRVMLENRRWSRIFKLQSEVHGKLIDKFSSSQELGAYMETEAGKRFLEAAPIPVSFGQRQQMPNAVARVLTPLQIGVVLVLLGMGFLLLRKAGPGMATPMLVLGTLTMMPGIGFILSAGISWVLADRLGLMPEAPAASNQTAAQRDPAERL